MAKFTKKPVTIEAVQFQGLTAAGLPRFSETPPKWLEEAMALDKDEPGSVTVGEGWRPPVLMVFTLEGIHRCNGDDFLIRGIKGEIYPCKPEIFAGSYDAAKGG